MIRIGFTLLFISFAITSLFSQNNKRLDSLLHYVDTATMNTAHVQNLLNIGYIYTYSTPDKAEPFLIKADSIAQLLPPNDRMNAIIQSYISILYEQQARYEEALIHIDKAITLFREADIPQYEAISIEHQGKIYMNMSQDDQAHESYTKAAKIFEELGDQKYLNSVYVSLGNVSYRMNNLDKAFDYYTTAQKGCLDYENYDCWETASNNLAVIHIKNNKPEEALTIYKELEKHQLENNNLRLLAKTYYNIAEVWDESYDNDIKSAEYSKKSLDIRLQLGNESNIIDSKLDYGRNMVRLKKYSQARIHLKEGLRIAEKLNTQDDISNAHRSLAQLYEATGEYKKAYESLKIHKELKDTLKNENMISRIADLETKYQTEKKEQEIAILESEKALTSQRLSSQKRTIIIVAVATAILSMLSIFLFRLFKQNQSQKLLLAESVKEKDYLLREIHHRVKNNLQVISSLLYLQSENLEDPAAQDAINVGRGRVKSMALIHQNLYGVNQSSDINLKKYLEDLSIELFDSYNLRGEEIELQLHISDKMVDVEILVPLGLILNELISNALKYAYQGKESGILIINADSENGILKISVIDDGIGIDQSKPRKDSFGAELIQSFADQLEATIHTTVDNGTKVSLHIPINSSEL